MSSGYDNMELSKAMTKNDIIAKINETMEKIVSSINSGNYENAVEHSGGLIIYLEDLIYFDTDETELNINQKVLN